MGTGLYLMKRLGDDMSERYGISFAEYLRRGYHLYAFDNDIHADIKRVKQQWDDASYLILSDAQKEIMATFGFARIEMNVDDGNECDICDKVTHRLWVEGSFDSEYTYYCDKCFLELIVRLKREEAFIIAHCEKCDKYILNDLKSCWGVCEDKDCMETKKFHIPEEDLLRVMVI